MSKAGTRGVADFALSLRGKRVLVAGLGLFGGGAAAARYLVAQGADVLVTDLKTEMQLAASLQELSDLDLELRLGRHECDDFGEADLVVANPAIPFRSEYLQTSIGGGVPVTTEIGLFAARFPGRTIAVTGTSGKTTTTTLLGQIISNAIPDTLVGGNMGVSLLEQLPTSSAHTTAVLELSSFQLRYLGMTEWRPDIAVVTNFAPNHLNIHDGIEDYRHCKQQLIAHQTSHDVTILNADDNEIASWAASTEARVSGFGVGRVGDRGVFVDGDCIVCSADGKQVEICRVGDLCIPGEHNQANACAAGCAAVEAGVTLDLIGEGMTSFQGVAHRLEYCGDVDGVSYYNDSIATSPERTRVAIEALRGPLVLIAGGSDKGLDYAELGKLISELVARVILIGETADRIADTVSGSVVDRVESLEDAVLLASRSAKQGDTVLLSPASASFDMFSNFEERGWKFKAIVSQLA